MCIRDRDMVGATGRHLRLSCARATCTVVSALTAVNRYLSVQAVGVELGARGGVSTASAQTTTRKAADGTNSRICLLYTSFISDNKVIYLDRPTTLK